MSNFPFVFSVPQHVRMGREEVDEMMLMCAGKLAPSVNNVAHYLPTLNYTRAFE